MNSYLVCMGDGAIFMLIAFVLFILNCKKNDQVVKVFGRLTWCLGLGIAVHCLARDEGYTTRFTIMSFIFTLSLAFLSSSFGEWVSERPTDNNE